MTRSDGELVVQSITFGENALTISYVRMSDVRHRLVQTHVLHMDDAHPDYAADKELLQQVAEKTLANALEDFAEAPVVDVVDLEDDDEDERDLGMGHG